MKKITIIGLSILSVFLLCSISYNPIIAEKEVIEIKENIEIVEDEDCECNNNLRIPYVICGILATLIITIMGILLLLDGLLRIPLDKLDIFLIPLGNMIIAYDELGCPVLPWNI